MCQASSRARNMESATSRWQSGISRMPPQEGCTGKTWFPSTRTGRFQAFFCVCVYTLLAVGVSLVSAHVQGMEPSICRDCLRGRWASGPRSEYLTPRKASTVILPPVWVLANSPQAFWGDFCVVFRRRHEYQEGCLTLTLEPCFHVFERGQ